MIGLDLETAELLPALDGAVTVRTALEARARETRLDADRLARAALPVVQRLFELGYLKPLPQPPRSSSRTDRVEQLLRLEGVTI